MSPEAGVCPPPAYSALVTQIAIADGTVVSIHYTLTLEDGTVADSSVGSEPLTYLHGAANIVPGLERQLTGRKPGEKLEADVPPAEGYGEFDPEGEQVVPRKAFPKGEKLQPGMMFHTEGPQGPQPLWIKEVGEAEVTITYNHPMAGRTLRFAIEVVEVRKASREEMEHGHVHGPGGHHH